MTQTLLGLKPLADSPIEPMLDLALYAESLGYSSIWTSETRFARDALTRIAAIATVTKKVRVGTSVINPYTRSPVLIAISAAVLDEMTKGRFVLGMGAGTKTYIEGQGIDYEKPLTRLKECASLLRRLWQEDHVSFDGETLHVSDVTLDFKPYSKRIPIYFGATGEKSIEIAKTLADGLILNAFVSREYVESVLKSISGKRKLATVANIMVSMDEDEDVAIRDAKPHAYRYLVKIPPITKANKVPESLVKELSSLEKRSGFSVAAKNLPDDLVKKVAAVGTPEDCRKWVRGYVRAGMTDAMITPVRGDNKHVLKEFAQLIRD